MTHIFSIWPGFFLTYIIISLQSVAWHMPMAPGKAETCLHPLTDSKLAPFERAWHWESSFIPLFIHYPSWVFNNIVVIIKYVVI